MLLCVCLAVIDQKCDKNKKVGHEVIAEFLRDTLNTFRCSLRTIAEQTHDNMEIRNKMMMMMMIESSVVHVCGPTDHKKETIKFQK